MQIKLHEITIQEVTNNYLNSDEEGVIGYSGKLNIRPKYQREFVYKEVQRNAVIETIQKDFPLNVMYWVKNDDNNYEVLDGQQRTISICEYVTGKFSLNGLSFHNLQDDQQKQILNYKLMIYFCEGENSEKLDWFETINIAGEKLTDQELRNAVYTGTWLSDAKKYFSKTGCAAFNLGSDYLIGSPIRQDYLEKVIKWISDNKTGDNIKIREYMGVNQHNPNANDLWLYFQNVINWVKVVFPKYRREMKGLEWGLLYNQFKGGQFDSAKLELEISNLMQDEEVSKKPGIYEYVLTRNEKYLNIRAFTDTQKREAYQRQDGVCVKCQKHFELDEMEADHITPWHEGGKTNSQNCQMLCRLDNRMKSGK
jgi:hypothetical protein